MYNIIPGTGYVCFEKIRNALAQEKIIHNRLKMITTSIPLSVINVKIINIFNNSSV